MIEHGIHSMNCSNYSALRDYKTPWIASFSTLILHYVLDPFYLPHHNLLFVMIVKQHRFFTSPQTLETLAFSNAFSGCVTTRSLRMNVHVECIFLSFAST